LAAAALAVGESAGELSAALGSAARNATSIVAARSLMVRIMWS
jgi:hypothetical protein